MKMLKYIAKRLLTSIFILFGVSIIFYALIRSMPGDYVQNTLASNPNVTQDMITSLNKSFGLDKGIVEGYIDWLAKAVKGDFGISFVYKQPVIDVIASKMWVSFALAGIAFILQLVIAIPLGIISATKQYSKTDYALTTLALVGISLPSFFFASVLQKTLAIDLGIFPMQGMMSARGDYEGIAAFFDMAWYFCLPILVFVVTGIGSYMRYVRTNMLDVINSDYIRTARAKGLSEKKVIYKHAFRNTLIPIVTMVGGTIPALFSGAIITEGIFSIEGVGKTAYDAMKLGDIPFMMGFMIFMAVLTLLGTLISDILYGVVDPRVKLG